MKPPLQPFPVPPVCRQVCRCVSATVLLVIVQPTQWVSRAIFSPSVPTSCSGWGSCPHQLLTSRRVWLHGAPGPPPAERPSSPWPWLKMSLVHAGERSGCFALPPLWCPLPPVLSGKHLGQWRTFIWNPIINTGYNGCSDELDCLVCASVCCRNVKILGCLRERECVLRISGCIYKHILFTLAPEATNFLKKMESSLTVKVFHTDTIEGMVIFSLEEQVPK